MKHTVLCVDDEMDNVEALERLFRRKYQVLKATSGREALKLLGLHKVSLIISDQRMPQMTGVEFLAQSQKLQPEAVKILLTGYTDIDSVIAAINSGQVYRYVTKPWDPTDLSTAVDRGVERFELVQELKDKNQALNLALEELKSLDEAKNHFMILINHELKTPLTVLLSFMELLKESKLTTEQRQYLDRMQGSAAKLRSLIEDSLELVSVETGQRKAAMEKLSLAKVLDKCLALFKEELLNKNLTVSGPKVDFKVYADQQMLEQIFRRLLDNAIKFATENSTIAVGFVGDSGASTTSDAKSGASNISSMNSSSSNSNLASAENQKHLVTVFIDNQGKSIAEEQIRKILKPFTLDENALNHSKGTGMGLALAQAWLKTHGSSLMIRNLPSGVQVSFALEHCTP